MNNLPTCPYEIFVFFSMQDLTDQMTFPIRKGLVPHMEMQHLHNCQHMIEPLKVTGEWTEGL